MNSISWLRKHLGVVFALVASIGVGLMTSCMTALIRSKSNEILCVLWSMDADPGPIRHHWAYSGFTWHQFLICFLTGLISSLLTFYCSFLIRKHSSGGTLRLVGLPVLCFVFALASVGAATISKAQFWAFRDVAGERVGVNTYELGYLLVFSFIILLAFVHLHAFVAERYSHSPSPSGSR